MQKIIDGYDYWDMAVLEVDCNHFADEIRIVYNDSQGGRVCYMFLGCYKTIFNHIMDYDKGKPVKEMSRTQTPYFMQDVKISESTEGNSHLWICKINMFPLYIEAWCKNIKIERLC